MSGCGIKNHDYGLGPVPSTWVLGPLGCFDAVKNELLKKDRPPTHRNLGRKEKERDPSHVHVRANDYVGLLRNSDVAHNTSYKGL